MSELNDIESIIAAFREFIEIAEKNDFIRDHDARFTNLRSSIKNKSSRLKPPLNVIAPKLYYIADHSFYCIELFEYKYYLLVKAMLNGIIENNPLSLANNCRSLLEQVATLACCMKAVEKMLDELKGQGDLEKINRIISNAELMLHRTYSGKGGKNLDKEDLKAIHVNTAIKALEDSVKDASDAYDYLCEFVHPNHGNNLLVSTGEIGKGKIGSRSNSDAIILKISKIGLNLLLFNKTHNEIKYPSLTWETHHLVELCFTRGAKITNVFSKKMAMPEGDGKTKETAFFFKKARTSQEAMKLTYDYLIEHGYNPNPTDGRRVNGGVTTEEGKIYLYDKWTTVDGPIWFKIQSYSGI